jgi:hypothetical protein
VKIEWILKILLISLFCIFIYIKYPTKKSQKEGSYSSYRFHLEREVDGVVQKLFKGGQNVSYLLVNNKELIVDDTTYSKLEIGDSLYKKANSDFYFIFRKNELIDSSNIREYYIH